MRRIYHLVPKSVWEQTPAGHYSADSLTSEGFIHCSNADQVARSANRFYAGVGDLLLLHIDPDQLTSPLRDEASDSGELFPHVYGPINRAAVIRVETLRRGPDGQWLFAP